MMRKSQLRFFLMLGIFQISGSLFASSGLSNECVSQLNKVGEAAIRSLDGSEYDGPAGINPGELKELPMTRHPFEKRLKYRVFETWGGIDNNEYRLRFTLSGTKSGPCFVYGLEIFHVSPFEQNDQGIKDHNANLK